MRRLRLPARWEVPAGLACGAATGAMLALSTPGLDLWPLAWIALVPVLFALEDASTRRRAMLHAWIAGTLFNVGSFYWMVAMLARFVHLPQPIAVVLVLALCAYEGLLFALFTWLVRAIRTSSALPMALVAPLVMVPLELVSKPVFLFPIDLSITQAWQVHVIQIAELTGPLGVSALVAMTNGALYDLLRDGRPRLRSSLASAGVLVAALVYGHVRIAEVRAERAAAPNILVGVVQPNVPFDKKGLKHKEVAGAQLADLQEQSRRLEADGAELILWPETSYPDRISRSMTDDFLAADPRHIRQGFTAPLVIGALTYEARQNGDIYNSAMVLDRDGHFVGRFDKTVLMVFGEYTPGLRTFPWLRRFVPSSADQFTPGQGASVLPFTTRDGRSWLVGPMICYEDIWPSFGHALAALHPHLLVNLTNDAWFGETTEPWQHLGASVYRAVETRTDLIRAVNTGVSAFVDATGRVYAKTYAIDPDLHPHAADRLLAPVALREGGHTLFTAVGNLFGYLCAAAMLFIWLGLPRLRKRSRN